MIAYSRGNFFLKNTFLLSKPEYPFDMGVSNTGCILTAGVAKLVDAPDLGSGAARRGGSSPSTRTIYFKQIICHQNVSGLYLFLYTFCRRSKLGVKLKPLTKNLQKI